MRNQCFFDIILLEKGEAMERTLFLVLDDNYLIKLPLYEGTSDEIDKYTTRFENASKLREKHQKEIGDFLSKHQDFLDARDSEKKKYFGRIVILENHNGEYEEKKVLFKKHLIAFREYIYKDKQTMQEFARLERIGYLTRNKKKLLSSHISDQISYSGNFKVKTRVERIRSEINKSKNFYDIIRLVVKTYKHQRANRPNLPTIEHIYLEYLKAKETKKEIKTLNSKVEKKVVRHNATVEDEEKEYVVNGFKYNADELHLFDLDEIDAENSDILPDGKEYDGKTY